MKKLNNIETGFQDLCKWLVCNGIAFTTIAMLSLSILLTGCNKEPDEMSMSFWAKTHQAK